MKIINPGATIGIIGGGQLGRMSALAAANLGYKVHIYSDHEDSPASHVALKTTVADYKDANSLHQFAESVDVITFEFENIPYESVKILEDVSLVRPSWKVLHTLQNRLREKRFINSIGIATAPFEEVKNALELEKAFKKLGSDCILKTVEEGYDGKGQFRINNKTDFNALWQSSSMNVGILEGVVDFVKEISVIIARTEDGKTKNYAPVENIHKNGILDTTIAPAEIAEEIAKKAEEIAITISNELEVVGLIAIEMFVTKNGDVLINEIAPRPHNSGHWTIDASITNQFEQFIRSVCGLPLGNTAHYCKAVMKNLIGDEVNLWQKHIQNPNAKIHLYGKKKVRDGRKMGHVTTVYPV